MPPGVESDRFDFRLRRHDGVQENFILQSQARRKNNPSRDADFDCANARLQVVGGAKRTVDGIRSILAFAPIVMRLLDCPVHRHFPFRPGSRKPRSLFQIAGHRYVFCSICNRRGPVS